MNCAGQEDCCTPALQVAFPCVMICIVLMDSIRSWKTSRIYLQASLMFYSPTCLPLEVWMRQQVQVSLGNVSHRPESPFRICGDVLQVMRRSSKGGINLTFFKWLFLKIISEIIILSHWSLSSHPHSLFVCFCFRILLLGYESRVLHLSSMSRLIPLLRWPSAVAL